MNFLKGIFSESPVAGIGDPGTGMPSCARLVMFIFAIAAVAWVSYLVIVNKTLPSLIELAGFIASPYIVNKTAATIADFKKQP